MAQVVWQGGEDGRAVCGGVVAGRWSEEMEKEGKEKKRKKIKWEMVRCMCTGGLQGEFREWRRGRGWRQLG